MTASQLYFWQVRTNCDQKKEKTNISHWLSLWKNCDQKEEQEEEQEEDEEKVVVVVVDEKEEEEEVGEGGGEDEEYIAMPW